MPIPPVPGNISHPFGEDWGKRRHNGIDYDVDPGTPVMASAFGLVVRSTYHEPREKIFTFRTGNKVRKEKKIYWVLWKCDNYISWTGSKETKTYIYSIRAS